MSAKIVAPTAPLRLPDQRLVIALAWAGTLPMLACLLMIESPFSLPILKSYSLSIIAFLSGSWWSTALAAGNQGGWQLRLIMLLSNLIVITGVFAVAFTGYLALLILATLFVCLLWGELTLPALRLQPAYYRNMRKQVTAFVAALHLIAFVIQT